MSKLISMRLPDRLDQHLEEYALERGLTRTGAILALVEQGLGGVGVRDTDCDMASNTANFEARLVALEQAVVALEQRNTVVMHGVSRPVSNPKFDPEKHYLGPLCQRQHNWNETGQSRYSKRNQACMTCEAERARERRAAKNR